MKILLFVFAFVSTLWVHPGFAVESLSTPTGVHVWSEAEAFEGYTLVSPNMLKETFLIDMDGAVVHSWKAAGNPGMYAELLPNGHLLRGIRLTPKPIPFGGVSGAIQELDWDGNVVWEHKIFGDKANTHHAFDRMPNGNTLILAWEHKSYEEAMAKGRKPGTLPKVGAERESEGVTYEGIWPDYVVEVNPQGKTVWEWHVWDYVGTGKDQFNINYTLPMDDYYGDSDWTHFNSVRYIPETDQVLLVSRNFGEVYLVNKADKTMAFRWGNPTTQGQGVAPSFLSNGDQQLFGPHDATWLGDGKVLLFDNGWQRPNVNRSRALVLNTKTSEVEWEYTAKNSNGFYSAYQGSAQKLPNGNILITSTQTGHIFEVTPTKKPRVVWEFVSPWTGKGPLALLTDEHALNGDINLMANFVHRAFRYAKEYPGFAGKDLSKKTVLFPTAPNWRELYEKAKNLN